MATQLELLDTENRPWALDHRTRETGREGVARARAALRRTPTEGAVAGVTARAA